MNENEKLNGNTIKQGDSFLRLRESQSKLLSELQAVRTTRNVRTSNAKMISILHHCPCRLRCLHDITTSEYTNSAIDRIFAEKHDTVKTRLIDAILCRFPGKLKISSEQKISNGTADISISSDQIIRLNNGKRIGIEVKSGQSIDLFQIERYLYELDILIVVRVPTRDVVKIRQKDIAEVLNKNILLCIEKIQQINRYGLIKVEGEWCRGCTASCPNKKPGYTGKPIASIADYAEFMRNVDIVIEKVIRELELEFGTN